MTQVMTQDTASEQALGNNQRILRLRPSKYAGPLGLVQLTTTILTTSEHCACDHPSTKVRLVSPFCQRAVSVHSETFLRLHVMEEGGRLSAVNMCCGHISAGAFTTPATHMPVARARTSPTHTPWKVISPSYSTTVGFPFSSPRPCAMRQQCQSKHKTQISFHQ